VTPLRCGCIFRYVFKIKPIFAYAKMYRNVFEENISHFPKENISLAEGEYHSREAGISLSPKVTGKEGKR